jgi:hypothetical protein
LQELRPVNIKIATFVTQKRQNMITNELFKHQWLKVFRAPGYYKNLAVNILLAFFGLYLAAIFIGLGIAFPLIIQDAIPQHSEIESFSGVLLYAVLAILMLRYFLQSLNTINLQSYQILPIRRNTIVNYVLLKPLLNPINYITLLFVIPLSIRLISKEYGVFGAFHFLAIIVFLVWFNVLVVSYLKRKFGSTLWGSLGVLLFVGALVALEYFKIFSLFGISKTIFGFLFSNYFGFALVFLLPLGAYYLNRAFFWKNYYAESFDEKLSKKQNYTRQFSFMDRFGKVGELIQLHIKIFLRNKRMKSTAYMMPIFLLYGFIFYNGHQAPAMLIFIGIFITGFPMLILGQWAIGLNSTHFDAIMSKQITPRDYILSYYYLMLFLCIASFILTTPYFFYGKEIIVIQTVAFLYNIGVNIFLLLFFGTFNNKRIELNTGGAMNFQGVSIKSFLVMIPIMFVPMLMMGIASAFDAQNIVYLILGALGVLGIIFTKPLLTLCEKQLLRKKYVLCEGFRKKGD